MKKLVIVIMLIASISFGVFLTVDNSHNDKTKDCIRIHIRANSNSEEDQNVKYFVKDNVVKQLVPLLSNCKSKKESYNVLKQNLGMIETVANQKLHESGFNYNASVVLKKEEFPARKYMEYDFPKGVYDALIVNLGTGTGNNWWCVAFPPLCFVGELDDNKDFYYKSKIMEIIENYYGRK